MPNETAREASDEKLLAYAQEICAEVTRRGLSIPGYVVVTYNEYMGIYDPEEDALVQQPRVDP